MSIVRHVGVVALVAIGCAQHDPMPERGELRSSLAAPAEIAELYGVSRYDLFATSPEGGVLVDGLAVDGSLRATGAVYAADDGVRLVMESEALACDLSLRATSSGDLAVTGAIDGLSVDRTLDRASAVAGDGVDLTAASELAIWSPLAGDHSERYIGGCFGAGVVILATYDGCINRFTGCGTFFDAYDYYAENCM